jgi:hypothetical protein
MTFWTILFTTALVCFGRSAWAHEGHGACKPIHEACEKAGKKGKAAKSCVKDIKEGKSVSGVTVSDADVTACNSEKVRTKAY